MGVQHPLLSVFLQESFDATSYARSVLGQSTAAASNQALEEGLSALDSELRTEVVSRHEELLQQVRFCTALRVILNYHRIEHS